MDWDITDGSLSRNVVLGRQKLLNVYGVNELADLTFNDLEIVI